MAARARNLRTRPEALLFSGESGKSKTKQAFKDECDINRVLDRGKRGASLAHLAEHSGQYGDFSDFTEQKYEEMLNQIAEAKTIFFDLPAELRQNEFQNNPAKFFEFVNNPGNNQRLEEIFPSMAGPGRQLDNLTEGGVLPPEQPEVASTETPPAAPESTETVPT